MASTVVLLRHAKSAYPPGVVDHDRPLNRRGSRDAPVAGQLIAGCVGEMDLALVSTATRAQQSWSLARPAMSVGKVIAVPELYLASAEAMLRRIQDADVDTVLVVSHNPGTEILAERLASNTDSIQYRRMVSKFPTAAFAVLTCDDPLRTWGYGCADLVAFEVARG